MTLQEILQRKGTNVFTISPHATLEAAVEQLVEENIGSLLVCQDNATEQNIAGIITERDILRTVATHRGRLEELQVADVMTTDLITVSPRDTIVQAMGLMTEHRIRHLPVISQGKLAGIISIGDVVKAHHDLLEQENFYMRNYILGDRGEKTCR